MLKGSELAQELGVSQARVSQWLSEGKLDGCFQGVGRDRRYDLQKVARALNRTLDPAQMMGNGARTRRVLVTLEADTPAHGDSAPLVGKLSPVPGGASGEVSGGGSGVGSGGAAGLKADSPLPLADAGRYEMARTLKAEEEARALKRRNEEAEGNFVLASEVERQVSRLIAQEVAEFDGVLRNGARAVADRLGVDFKAVRQILIEAWRTHRATRKDALAEAAEAADLSDAERAADI